MHEDEQLKQAYIYRKQHNFDKAVNIYECLLQDGHKSYNVYMAYGKALYRQFDDLDLSAHMFEQALEIRQGDEDAMLWLATIYGMGYGKGYEEAVVVYQAVYEQNPLCINAYEGMAMSYGSPGVVMSQHDYITYLSIVVELLPNNINAKWSLANGYIDIGKKEIGLKILEEMKISMDENEQSYEYVLKKIELIKSGMERLPTSLKRALHHPRWDG